MRLMSALLLIGAFLAPPALAQEAGVSGQLEQSTSTSPREKAEFAAGAIQEIENSVRTVETLMKEAQADKEKNAERIECLSRKLIPMQTLAEVARQASNSMKQSLAANDGIHADQDFRKIAVALTKAREFFAEAQACVGDSDTERGETSATVTDGGDNYVSEDDVPSIPEVPAGESGTEQ